MQLPCLTRDQIQQRCTAQSFTRGLEYFHEGAIGTPVLHGYTLSATCQGTEIHPYRISIELMPTTIARAVCSCPYDGKGDCKHIVALLLNYVHAPETICCVDAVLAEFAEKPKENLLQVISELLKRTPELTPLAQVYADIPIVSSHSEPIPLVTIYGKQIDSIFGRGFLEQHQLQEVLIQLERLVQHAESLAHLGETQFALSLLHALIHRSVIRYPDTFQGHELPRFVGTCTKIFTQIAVAAQEAALIGFDTASVETPLADHYQMLLDLSFEAEPVFTPLLTCFLEDLCLTQETSDLQGTIVQRLEESQDREAHVRLLLALYLNAGETEAYVNLAETEGETYRLVHLYFTHQQDAAAWELLQKSPLSVDEYWCFLKSRIAKRVPQFTDKLLSTLRCHHPNIAISVYQRLIEELALSQRRRNYEKLREHLTMLKHLYSRLEQQNAWAAYLHDFRERHARKPRLLQIISKL